ncbi:hypothetical protein [Rhodoferax antarcticus]|uniref:hypothetical protein n=1 Tax=Rhodoferax antarcticus TaxID=81479 RepID=UPI00222487F5|nr:hypothetical protein [Rhodoferax antarcticus]MCW2311436.1 hypothetical protein [Rhodoferax antarcticus]
MSWWTSAPGLTPIIAYDSSHFQSTSVLTDLTGAGNHADMAGQSASLVVVGTNPVQSITCVKGTGAGWTYQRVTRPTAGVLMALVSHVNPRVMLFSDYGMVGNYHALLIETDVTTLSPHGQIRCEGTANSVGLSTGVAVKFVAIVFDANGYQYYCNGSWVGAKFSTPLTLLSSVGSNWPSSWGLNASLSALGMFDGIASLTYLQDLEAQVRLAVVGPPVVFHGFGTDLSRVNTIPTVNLATQGLGDNTGRINTAPMQALDGLGVRNIAIVPILGKHDIYFGGVGQVAGTVKNTPATPVRRRVLLIEDSTRAVIRETWSEAATGVYAFERIAMNTTYTVVGYDHTQAFRAVVADRVVPELMQEHSR